MQKEIASLFAVSLLAACEAGTIGGTLGLPPPTALGGAIAEVDGSAAVALDSGLGPLDAAPIALDAAPLDPDAALDPDAGSDRDAGATRDAGPTDASAHDTGPVADAGFLDAAPPYPDGDPAGRSTADLCAAYHDAMSTHASASWIPGAAPCDPGSLSPEAIDDTLRRINFYRWLTGLPPVSDDVGLDRIDQACSVMMATAGMLNHNPPPTFACYTRDGANAAGQSNLALGNSSAAAGIDQFMQDGGNEATLGHRRWILNGPLGPVGIGFAAPNGRRGASCLAVFGMSGHSDRLWTAYPNPGPAPIGTAFGVWSFHSNRWGLGSATVNVVRVSDGMSMPITVGHPPYGYGPDTVSFTPSGWRGVAGERYRVTVDGITGSTSSVTYEVLLTAC